MKSGFWNSVLNHTRFRCYKGKLFHRTIFSFMFADMEDSCWFCGHDFKVEDGFFLEATYLSYVLAVAAHVPLMLVLVFIFHIDFSLVLIILSLILGLLLPVIVRISRAVWFNFFFLNYGPDCKTKSIEELLSV